MSNDVFPDWAITTSARLLKRGWRDGGRRMVAVVSREQRMNRWRKLQKEQQQEILHLFHIKCTSINVYFISYKTEMWCLGSSAYGP